MASRIELLFAELGNWEMVKGDKEREGMGMVAKVADRITPKVEPPPCVYNQFGVRLRWEGMDGGRWSTHASESEKQIAVRTLIQDFDMPSGSND